MIHKIDIVLPLEISDYKQAWIKKAAQTLQVKEDQIWDVRVIKKSIDARKKAIKIQLRLEVAVEEKLPSEETHTPLSNKLPAGATKIIIVGLGPAGIFAALEAIKLGYQPIVIERGKDVYGRRFDLPPIHQKGIVNEDSNYCFGEGGAGTFSDGKLYTRATKRGNILNIYKTLVAHGAPSGILTDAHPHIGSNKLPKVVINMRKSIIENGGEVHFEQKVIDFILKDNKIQGVRTHTGKEFTGHAVILATGHSARDIYTLIHSRNILMEQKPFAMGVRIEHPQPLIDQIQYHLGDSEPRPENLPAARYQLATKIENRGVHSFCMCPGGFIMPAATQNDEVVVNGMSLSKRNSPYANSGMVVSVEVEDTLSCKADGIMAGVRYQKKLEQKASQAGGGKQAAPGQRLVDFMAGRFSSSLPTTSYIPGATSARIDEILPPWMVERMKKAFTLFGKNLKGYISQEALLLGFETRTSSPLRIPRDPQTLQHTQIQSLYPCGEGAGYAGGIVSAAMDGIRCMQSIANE